MAEVELERWRASFARTCDDKEAAWDEEHSFWDLIQNCPQFSASDFLLQPMRRIHEGSRPGKRPNMNRLRQKGVEDLWNDYFAPLAAYGEYYFRRRYKMSKKLFNRIFNVVVARDSYFNLKYDAAGIPGLSPHFKITAAICQLAYGIGADASNEYCWIGESIALESLYRFVRAIRELFQPKYLQKPNAQDFQNRLEINQQRGFPGMFGSLDCMHWVWKNCPVAWQGQYGDKGRVKSIILKAADDKELWIWHAFWGMAKGSNDLNVLDRSPLLNEWLENASANVSFHVNGVEYNKAYLLVDGIYPEWSMFISTIHSPQNEKLEHFAKCKEASWKDVERAFGVLQARWAIIKQPARSWYESNLTNILMACIVLHTMILEDEHGKEFEPYLRLTNLC